MEFTSDIKAKVKRNLCIFIPELDFKAPPLLDELLINKWFKHGRLDGFSEILQQDRIAELKIIFELHKLIITRFGGQNEELIMSLKLFDPLQGLTLWVYTQAPFV